LKPISGMSFHDNDITRRQNSYRERITGNGVNNDEEPNYLSPNRR